MLSNPDGHIQESFPEPKKLSRRMRPPDLEIKANMEDRQPLRKAGRRESRLGLGRLFGRHRLLSEAEAARESADLKEPKTMTGLIAGPPYALQSPGLRSEIHLVSSKDDKSSLLTRPKTASVKSPSFAPLPPPKSPLGPNSGKRRGSIATASIWDPVPFFQAWPQSVRTATLPACVQGDHLLRMHNKREMLTQINHPDLGDEKALFVEMARKKHRRNSSSFKLDWTTKTYILVTSGYLLQYAAEGSHDRLPEKVVQLTKDSAAFASDVIPGRHWVLQVSSVFEDGALTSQDTRSLLGKFGLREKEKRQASDMLMVFENASVMESWMSMLRREIEVLGGKTLLTETGAPKQDDDMTLVEVTPSSPIQRTPVVRDPHRFLRNGSMPDLRWDAAITFDGPELHLDATLTEVLPDHAFDDNSTTNSFVSQDGHQLDGLRDSSNRYSFMSAARTIVTSDSSACNSPIRDSFGSGSQGSHPSEEATPMADDLQEPRLRPNAADIEDRRQSYRTSNIFLDSTTGYLAHRQHSSLSSVQEPPNFSLPQVAGRRRAASQATTDHIHIAYTASGRPPRRPRRPPPPTLGFTRPLSIVADSPSPSRSKPCSPLKTGDSLNSTEPPDTPSIFSTWVEDNTTSEYDLSTRASSRGSMRTSFQVSIHTSPRKYSSMNALRPADNSLWDDAPRFDQPPPFRATIRPASPNGRSTPTGANDSPRSGAFADAYTGTMPPPRSRSPIQRAMAAQRRASMYNLSLPSTSPRRGSVSVFANNTVHRLTQSDHHEDLFRASMCTTGPMPSPRNPRRESMLSVPGHVRNGSNGSTKSFLSNRRSMPQMPQLRAQGWGLGLGGPTCPAGPPPAPPPNKALPPIPMGKPKRRSESIPPQMRMPVSVLSGEEF